MSDPASSLHAILDQHKPAPSQEPNILRTLLAVQDATGYVPLEKVGSIARALGVTESDVAGVISYYPDLRTKPTGRHIIRICMGESCVANHCDRILHELRQQVRIDIGETEPGNRFSIEQVFCMGNCPVGPTLLIDDDLYARVMPTQVTSLLDKYP
jgi:NADH:ubiquinone oxidoreductase subunit E